MLHWALTAAAVLMLLISVRTLFLSSRSQNRTSQRLGCGFSIVAIGLWVYVLRSQFGDLMPALRLGLALLLLLPAVTAVANPARMRLIPALGGLLIAVFLAGPVLQDLWQRYGPDTRSNSERTADRERDQLEELRAELEQRLEQLAELEATTRGQIQSQGTSWEELEQKPEALKSLELLAAIHDSRDEAREALARVESALDERNSPAPAVTPVNSELDRLAEELRSPESDRELGVVEQHLQRQELRKLFEREVQTP